MTTSTQKMLRFNVKAITNGFILEATYVVDESKPASDYGNQKFEKIYFKTVDVMCSFINEHYTGDQEAAG